MRVIIVDDEKDTEFLFKQKFRKEIKADKVELIFTRSGIEAIKFIEENELKGNTIILSDINMPEMGGIELVKEIRRRNLNITFYIASAYCNDEIQARAIESGANGYISKPIDFEVLKNKLFENI